MRCPMMMFSLSPRRSSRAPRIAASVSTRVVSWNDAAEMNDCVVRLAFVMLRLALLRMHRDLALAALDLAEPHGAVDLGDRGRVLGPPGLEQLGHPRQAARDIAGLVRLARHLGQHETGVHLLAVLDREL